jgi:hypothetical protein
MWRRAVLARYTARGHHASLFDGHDWPGTGKRAA